MLPKEEALLQTARFLGPGFEGFCPEMNVSAIRSPPRPAPSLRPTYNFHFYSTFIAHGRLCALLQLMIVLGVEAAGIAVPNFIVEEMKT